MLFWTFKLEKHLYDHINNVDFLIIRSPSLVSFKYRDCKKNEEMHLSRISRLSVDAYWNHSWKGKIIALYGYVTKKMVKNVFMFYM